MNLTVRKLGTFQLASFVTYPVQLTAVHCQRRDTCIINAGLHGSLSRTEDRHINACFNKITLNICIKHVFRRESGKVSGKEHTFLYFQIYQTFERLPKTNIA